MLACNYDVCKNGLVQNYKEDLNCFLVIVRIPTEGNRYNGPLYIITANFDSIMNIVTSYEWFVRYCVRGIDFCYIPFCQLFWPIHVTMIEISRKDCREWVQDFFIDMSPLFTWRNWKDFLRRFMMRMKKSVSFI